MDKLEIEALMARVRGDINEFKNTVRHHGDSISYATAYDLLKRTNELEEQFLRIENMVEGLVKALGLK